MTETRVTKAPVPYARERAVLRDEERDACFATGAGFGAAVRAHRASRAPPAADPPTAGREWAPTPNPSPPTAA